MNKNQCLICGGEIIPLTNNKKLKCHFCQKEFETNFVCENDHYICDECHSKDAFAIITAYCLNNNFTDPIEAVQDLMTHDSVKMHGPEHHYLIPAVLITAYHNSIGKTDQIEEKLAEAAKRSKNILGGFCGFYGACGAAVGCGIAISIINESTPMSVGRDWQMPNEATSKALAAISKYGGPRCCKRNSFIAILDGANYIKENFDVELDLPSKVICNFSQYNNECLYKNCLFYKNN